MNGPSFYIRIQELKVANEQKIKISGIVKASGPRITNIPVNMICRKKTK